MALIGSVMHQPPLAVLVQQAGMMALTADNAAYCLTPLMTHPLMRQRLAALWGMLEAWTPVLVPGGRGAQLADLPGEHMAAGKGSRHLAARLAAVQLHLAAVCCPRYKSSSLRKGHNHVEQLAAAAAN
jgi:hypothetical protein